MSTLDLGKLIRFGISKGIEEIEKRTGFPMQEGLDPIVTHGISSLNIPEVVEIDPITEGFGRLIFSAVQQNKKNEEARRLNASEQQQRNGNNSSML